MTSKPTILAIDDVPTNLKALASALAEEYEIQVATSGTQGLAYAEASPPDLILLDIMMPEMDGYEVCRRLKADALLQHIPVIFITAHAEAEAETIGLDLGAADFLQKPINVPIVRRRIHNLLERESLRRQLERQRDELEEQVKERTLSLSIAKEVAEGACRLKTAILSNISHEFRTPMNGILGMVGMARRRTVDPKIVDYLSKAEQTANHLLGSLTGLLELALAESKRLTLDRTQFRLGDVTAKAIECFGSSLQVKNLTLECRDAASPSSTTQWLMGDPHRIGQILHELISNAIKFSESGTIRLESAIEEDGSGKVWLNYKVCDEGIGIAPKYQQSIFDPFQQVDGSSTRQYGGNGIGLALCQQLARHMGGEIKVDSTLGRGATFLLRIPTEKRRSSPADEITEYDLETSLRSRPAGAHILVAEDDHSLQLFIRTVLEAAGLRVSTANDGQEAIEYAGRAQFDLILMDLIMPKVSGIDAACAIRALPQNKIVPILAVTSMAFEDDRSECLRVGINAHISKPVMQDQLLSTVLEWLDSTRTLCDRLPA